MQKRNLISVLAFSLLMVVSACHSKKTSKEQQLMAELEKEVYSGQSLQLDKATQLIDLYVAYETQHRGDTVAAEYLFKAAELASSIKSGSQAVLYYDRIQANYPTWSKTPDCLFLMAFTYENLMQNLSEAEKYYNEFLVKYPNHIYAKDAKASLDNLGLSPEELIRKFEQQNQAAN